MGNDKVSGAVALLILIFWPIALLVVGVMAMRQSEREREAASKVVKREP